MKAEYFHNIIKNFEIRQGKKPTVIHLSPNDSIDFIKSIDDLLPISSNIGDKIKYDMLMYQKFPENAMIFGVKLLFSQPSITVLH